VLKAVSEMDVIACVVRKPRVSAGKKAIWNAIWQ